MGRELPAWEMRRLKERTYPLVNRIRKLGAHALAHWEGLKKRRARAAVPVQVIKDFQRHGMALYAGNFAYSAFLALFPLLLLVVSIVGFVFSFSPAVMQRVVDGIKQALPEMPGAVDDMVDSIVRFRGAAGIFSLLGLLWTVSKIAYAIQRGFERVWQMKERSFVKKRLSAMGIMLLLILFVIIGLGISFFSTQFLSRIGERAGRLVSVLTLILGVLLGPAVSAFVFAVLYRTVPLRKPGWKEIMWGAVSASVLLYVAEYLLGIYFTRISKAQALYGSLGVVLGIVLWLYMVGIFIFLGAEIVHVLQESRGTGGATACEPVGGKLHSPGNETT